MVLVSASIRCVVVWSYFKPFLSLETKEAVSITRLSLVIRGLKHLSAATEQRLKLRVNVK